MLENKVKTVSPGSSQPEIFNVVGQLHTLDRLQKDGVLLPYSDEGKARLGYKPNGGDNTMSVSKNIKTERKPKEEVKEGQLAYKEQ